MSVRALAVSVVVSLMLLTSPDASLPGSAEAGAWITRELPHWVVAGEHALRAAEPVWNAVVAACERARDAVQPLAGNDTRVTGALLASPALIGLAAWGTARRRRTALAPRRLRRMALNGQSWAAIARRTGLEQDAVRERLELAAIPAIRTRKGLPVGKLGRSERERAFADLQLKLRVDREMRVPAASVRRRERGLLSALRWSVPRRGTPANSR